MRNSGIFSQRIKHMYDSLSEETVNIYEMEQFSNVQVSHPLHLNQTFHHFPNTSVPKVPLFKTTLQKEIRSWHI